MSLKSGIAPLPAVRTGPVNAKGETAEESRSPFCLDSGTCNRQTMGYRNAGFFRSFRQKGFHGGTRNGISPFDNFQDGYAFHYIQAR